jgi:peptidoglycan LD-endopeptidase LytH
MTRGFRPAFRVLAILGLLLALAPGLSGGSVSADTQQELQGARTELAGLVDRIEAESAVLGDLQAQANAVAGRINEANVQIADTQARVVQLQQEVRIAAADVEARQAEVNRRASVSYQYGPGSNLDYVLGATSLGDLAERLEIVDRVATSDRDALIDLRLRKRELDAKRREVEALELRLRAQHAELDAHHGLLESKLTGVQAALSQLQTDRDKAKEIVRSLEAKRQREIEAERLRQAELAAALAARQTALAGAVLIDGIFQVCPVDEPHAYSDDFGAPRYTGGYHPHQGNDIFAPYGTPIRAPFPGTAEDATNEIGGLAVKVFGDKGWVYNAHLSGFAALGPVEAGDIVGFVGNSGNALGTSPHDHFEWHPGGGDAVNPFPYLNAVC